MRLFLLFLAAVFFLFEQPALASEPDLQALANQIRTLTESIQTLQLTVESQKTTIDRQSVRLAAIEKGERVPQLTPAPQPAEAPALSGVSQNYNPDIGVVGTVQANLTNNSSDTDGNDTIVLKELELNFSHYVDPYSRVDAVISFNDALEEQNANIEEAYYTRWGLPFGFTTQLGKFRSKFGKENLLHLHALDTVDYPLVIQDFLGEEGLASSGVRLQNTIPNPWDIPLEITGELLRGNNGTSFSGISRTPIFNTHLKSFFEIAQDMNLELGTSAMFGDENVDDSERGGSRYGVHLIGFDGTYSWFLPEGRVLKLQSEWMMEARTSLVHPNANPWGFYVLADYRFSPRFSVGTRVDYVQPLDVVGEHLGTTGISPYFTIWQSEFVNYQLQYTHLEPASSSEKPDNAFYFRVNFMIGAHKHPVQ